MSYDLVANVIEYENGRLTGAETLTLFSHLIKTGHIDRLQGRYQRVARRLQDTGQLTLSGEITQYGKTINGIKETA